MTRLAARLLPDGRRLHLNDGPIDLVIEAWGEPAAIAAAYRAARTRAGTILDELCLELPLLRRRATPSDAPAQSVVARRMQGAVAPYCEALFITPMAAVAGAVAEDLLGAMWAASSLGPAYVHDGGDIPLPPAPGQPLTAGRVRRPQQP